MQTYQLDFLEGLLPFVLHELKPLGARLGQQGKDHLRLEFPGNPRPLLDLKTVVAVSRVDRFEVPRPKALLGHQHFTRLLGMVQNTLKLGSFKSFRFAAAGADSSVFQRLAEELHKSTRLKHDPEEGEMVLRFLRVKDHWEVLLRLSPRPLSARPWRVANMEGGLNATVAAAMLQLADLHAHDGVFNPMCGSGTLMVEAALLDPTLKVSGCDIAQEHLQLAERNIAAAGLSLPVFRADATRLDLPDASLDVVLCDVPWGDDVGSNSGNQVLYPAFLQEMARLTRPGSRMVLISQEVRLMERLLKEQQDWKVQSQHKVYHGGHYPRIYLLARNR